MPSPRNLLAAFAPAVKTLVDTTPGSTDNLPETAPHGGTDTPGATLTRTATPSIYTDTSGWVDFARASVAPIHGAVAAAEQTDGIFNVGQVVAYGSPVVINEAAQPWARADVLSYAFPQSGEFRRLASRANRNPVRFNCASVGHTEEG